MLNKRKLIKILISPLGFFQLAIGLLLFGLGASVILAWHIAKLGFLPSPSLLMSYNAALGFFMGGIVMLFNLIKYNRLGFACQLLMVGIGLAGILEYFGLLDSGINWLLLSFYLVENNNLADPILPHHTASFILTGIAFYFLSKHKKYSSIIASSLGVVAIALGLVSFGVYLFDFLTASDWRSFSPMAFALGTTMLGSGILVSARNHVRSPQSEWQWMSSVETGNNSIQKRLNLLADECGDDALQEIILVFLEECLSKIIRLQHLIYYPDKFYLIAREAHTLKGACLNLGAIEMAELSADLEAAASGKDVEDVSFLINQLKSEFNRTYFVINTGIRDTMTVK